MMSGFTPTPEQDHALLCYRTSSDVVIQALAGTGKTSTLEMLARYKPSRQGLYLAFNKVIATEAQRRFSGTGVRPMTMHALALRNSPDFFRERLQGAQRFTHWGQIAKVCGVTDGYSFSTTDQASVKSLKRETITNCVKDTVGSFMRTADPELTVEHVRLPKALHAADGALEQLRALVLNNARILWADYVSPTGTLPMNHQAYVKHWQLSSPSLNTDFVFVDEAQDLDPLLIDVILKQQCQRIVVGDENQAIYEWRGARNSMQQFPAAWRSTLTQSFRFGPGVAEEAQKWLSLLGSDLQISGTPMRDSRVYGMLHDAPDVSICRTNAGAIVEVVEGQRAGRSVKIAGDKGYELSRMSKGALELQQNGKTSQADFQIFESWDQLVEFSETEEGAELEAFVGMVDRFGAQSIVDAIDACVKPGQHADLTVSTAHTSKGMEWGSVQVSGDFARPKKDKLDETRHTLRAEEARLAYVTVTRAQDLLGTGSLNWINKTPDRLELI
ncbi:UvrD-helicase domain-containing protein [Leucobacter luti]|nr:UvrD-helicase domain-containing protein [Leucobacter luti]